MSRFYIDDSPSPSSRSSTSGDSDNLDTLPYPVPLQRNDFLTPDFHPSTYLSTLHNRHQTLEDLRSELRSRSQLLSKELLDLVNSNYQEFLGLGTSLRNGDEKVEEVRVGLLGFRKEVEGVREIVEGKEEEAKRLVDERVEIRQEIGLGRRLVEFEDRLKGLEGLLMVDTAGRNATTNGSDELSDSEDDSDEDEETYSMSIAKLRKHVLQYRLIQQVARATGEEHPFVVAQASRIIKVRNTILLDLNTALQQAKVAGTSGADRVMKIMKVYADMDEPVEAVKVLKSLKAA